MFLKHQRVVDHILWAFQGMATSSYGEKCDLREIGKFIKAALEQGDDIESAKVACGILTDLVNNSNPYMIEFMDDFVPGLHNILQQ